MADSDGSVLVRVRSASHPSCEDLEFSCDPKLTSVRQVKEKIRSMYTFHPDIADQRLIYSGHLLDDVQLLTDVFGLNGPTNSLNSQTNYQHSGPYIIHLACTSKSYITNQRSGRRGDTHSTDTPPTSAFSAQMPNPMMHDPTLREGQSSVFGINTGGGIPPEFYALHQLYVEQMSAYMRNWNLAYGVRNVAFTNVSVGGNAPNFANANNVQGVNNGPPQQAPRNIPPQNERPRQGGNLGGLGGMVGGAAVANDDEENQRDLLDWAYTLSRFLLILSVVYFYSNFTRFLVVVIFTAAIAIFQRRPRQNQDAQADVINGQQERQGNNNNNNNNGNDAVDPAGPNVDENRNEPQPEADNEREPDVTPPQQQPENVTENDIGEAAEANVAAGAGQHGFAYYRDVTWTFLTTFFTSLIPEMPQHN